MSTNPNLTTVQTAWINFVKSVQLLLVPQIDDRPLDQYLAFRNAVLDLVQSQQFLNDLQSAWEHSTEPNTDPKVLNALLLELQAFPASIEVAEKTEKPEATRSWWRRLFGRAGTTVGSVKDIVKDLPPYAKMAITLFKEVIDIFNKD